MVAPRVDVWFVRCCVMCCVFSDLPAAAEFGVLRGVLFCVFLDLPVVSGVLRVRRGDARRRVCGGWLDIGGCLAFSMRSVAVCTSVWSRSRPSAGTLSAVLSALWVGVCVCGCGWVWVGVDVGVGVCVSDQVLER